MSVEKAKINYLNKGRIDEEQVMVESVLNVPDLKQVLWVESESIIENQEAIAKEVSVSGQVVFEVFYLNDEGKIKFFETTTPFLSKLQNDKIETNSNVSLMANTLNAEYNSESGKLFTLVKLFGYVTNQRDLEILTGGDDDVCVKTEEITGQEMLKAENIVFTEEISYPITDKMENILRVFSRASLKEIIADNNMFSISGEIHTTIQYVNTTEEQEKIMAVNFSEPFKREIEVQGLTPEGVVQVCVNVKKDSYKYELDKEQNKIIIDVPLQVKYVAYDELKLQSAVDAFSLSNQLNITSSSMQKNTQVGTDFFENKFEGSVQLEANAPRIDKIIGFSNPNLQVTLCERQDENLVVEGIVSFDISYLNDESESITTQKQEIPFKLNLTIDDKSVFYDLVSCELIDADVVARRGREIFVDGKIKTQVDMQKKIDDVVITDCEIGESLPQKQHAIEIYFGKKGDDLWDIARELRVVPDQILLQNPDVVLPLEQSENIVVYNAKKYL